MENQCVVSATETRSRLTNRAMRPERLTTESPLHAERPADQRTEGSHQRMVRPDCDTGKIPEVPQDDYMPVWNYEPVRASASDSMAMGYWVWRKVFVGYVGAITGVMLGPEWADILEVTPEPNRIKLTDRR